MFRALPGRLELSASFRSPRWRRVLCHRGLLHNELQRVVAIHSLTFFSPRQEQQPQQQPQQQRNNTQHTTQGPNAFALREHEFRQFVLNLKVVLTQACPLFFVRHLCARWTLAGSPRGVLLSHAESDGSAPCCGMSGCPSLCPLPRSYTTQLHGD